MLETFSNYYMDNVDTPEVVRGFARCQVYGQDFRLTDPHVDYHSACGAAVKVRYVFLIFLI